MAEDENPSLNERLCLNCQTWNDADRILAKGENWGTVLIDSNLEALRDRPSCMVCLQLAISIAEWVEYCTSSLPESSRDLQRQRMLVLHPRSQPLLALCDPREYDNCVSTASNGENSINCVIPIYTAGICGDPGSSSSLVNIEVQLQNNEPIESIPYGIRPTFAVQLSLTYDKGTTHLAGVEKWDTSFCKLSLLKDWLNVCFTSHGTECLPISSGTLPSDFRLIDVQRRCVVTMDSIIPHDSVGKMETESQGRVNPPRYIALSYRWPASDSGLLNQLENQNLEQLQEENSLAENLLSEIIEDAIKLCHDLGENYLWIDRFCIVQDDKVSKNTQIQAMNIIYGMALLTIVAAADGSLVPGIPGVRGRPRGPSSLNNWRMILDPPDSRPESFNVAVNDSIWNSRGWTYQERLLSRRRLYLTDHQAYFSCAKSHFWEEVGDHDFQNESYSSLGRETFKLLGDIKDMKAYFNCLYNYTRRGLSFDTDILHAFDGVSKVLETQLQTQFLFGLPERHFVQALLWNHEISSEKRPNVPHIPSWSWAAWQGPIVSGITYLSDHFRVGTLVKYYTQDPAMGLRLVNSSNEWMGEKFDFCSVDEDSLVLLPGISGKLIPNNVISTVFWRARQHNPWSKNVHEALDPNSCSIALKHPGCLVFNTTVASLFLVPLEDGKSSQMISLHLYDSRGDHVGLAALDKTWVHASNHLERPHEFIILCADILSFKQRRNRVLLGNGSLLETWLLRVMLIKRHEGVAHRVGIGMVYANKWDNVGPEWETIVLA